MLSIKLIIQITIWFVNIIPLIKLNLEKFDKSYQIKKNPFTFTKKDSFFGDYLKLLNSSVSKNSLTDIPSPLHKVIIVLSFGFFDLPLIIF